MPLDSLLSAFVTLLVVVDPIGLAPIFVALTHGLPQTARRRVGVRACLIAGAILAGSAMIGDLLLRRLGITPAAFQIAGGLLLFTIAAEMVYGNRTEHQSKTAEQAIEEHVRYVAAFPLAIPLMAGPGAIAATVLLASASRAPVALAALIGVVGAVCGITLAVFYFANQVARFVGVTGNIVLARLLGIILAALAVQYVIDGVRAVLPA